MWIGNQLQSDLKDRINKFSLRKCICLQNVGYFDSASAADVPVKFQSDAMI